VVRHQLGLGEDLVLDGIVVVEMCGRGRAHMVRQEAREQPEALLGTRPPMT
jgi:hypothetical protein